MAAGSVSSDSEFVKVSRSVKCTAGQDCILSCSFDNTDGGWDEKSGVIWRRAETDHIVHSNKDTDQLAHQLPQYVSRTSLFDSELQRGNASLLLRRVREEDAGEYRCFVSTPRLSRWGLTEVVVVPAPPTTAPAHVTVPSSVKCTEGQDCILNCSFNDTAGGWDEKSAVIWRRAETDHIVHRRCNRFVTGGPRVPRECNNIVHRKCNNTDQLADQSPQYVSRTSLFDSELQRGNASLLLRRVGQEDAGKYKCSVFTPRLSGSGLTEVDVVPALLTTAPAPVTVPSSDWRGLGALLPLLALCVIAGRYARQWIYKNRRMSNNASSPEQAVPLSDVIEEPSEVRPLPCTAQYTQSNTSSQNEIVTLN